MESKESIETRKEMAKMHQSALNRIHSSYKKKQCIEVCWLCYACFESRVNRILEKICSGCSKEQRRAKRHIGIPLQINCYPQNIRGALQNAPYFLT